MTGWRIVEGGLDDARVVALIEHHSVSARAATPGSDGHSFAVERLKGPDIRFFSAWIGDEVMGIGALRRLSAHDGEVKSMHTTEAARGQGVGTAVLGRIEVTARSMGMATLSLETHPGEHFAAAVALYRRHGFVDCTAFGDHRADPGSLFMTKELK